MESKRLNVAKYLVRGESVKFAFHGVLLSSYLFLIIIFCSGCYWFADNRVVIKPEQKPVSNKDRWIALAPFVKKHFDTGDKTLEEIATDLYLAEYLLQIEAEKYGVTAKDVTEETPR